MRMSKKKELVPKLRFSEFYNSKWKVTKLGKIAVEVNERAGDDTYLLMSVTSGVGLVLQVEKFGREIAGDSYKNYIVIRKYDFAYNKSATKQFPEGYLCMLSEYDAAAIPKSIFTCFRIIDSECYPDFLDYLFHNNYHGRWLRKYIEVGARAHGSLSIDTKYLWMMPIAMPCLREQQKIADCLASVDVLIRAETGKLELLKKYKKGLMQKLFPVQGKTVPEWRFPEFRDCGEWETSKAGNVLHTIIPSKKIAKSEYKSVGSYPIIDQSREYISGWTDDEKALNRSKLPLIIFGDHTCILKFVDQPFAQGADGIKIFAAERNVDAQFLYYCLENLPINSDGYKRHYSALKEQTVMFPDEASGEQQKIADCLSETDMLIKAQSDKVEALKLHKRGLMQGLFPSSAEVDE